MAKSLSSTEIDIAIAQLSGWQVRDNALYKEFKFNNFAQALGWMVAAGVEADKLNHHPEWSNIYNRVKVILKTHDLGNVISDLDQKLAHKMDELAQAMGGQ